MGTTVIATIMGTCMVTRTAAISIAPAMGITSTARCIIRAVIITTTAMCTATRTGRTLTADCTAITSTAGCTGRTAITTDDLAQTEWDGERTKSDEKSARSSVHL